MELETVPFSDLQPNFLNLSLLICQLFAGGNFRMAHILYHPEVYDDCLISAIDSACPLRIPKMTIDASAQKTLRLDRSKRNDHMLQLIFLPPNQLLKSMDRMKGLLTFYRVFIITSNQDLDILQQKRPNDFELMKDLNSSSLLVVHSNINGAIKQYRFSKSSNKSMEPVNLEKNQPGTEMDIFNSALGEYEHGRAFGVVYIDKIKCESHAINNAQTSLQLPPIYGRFYFTTFNMTYIEELNLDCIGHRAYSQARYVRPIPHPTYDELSSDSEPIVLGERITEQTTELHFKPLMFARNKTKKINTPINPYKLIDIYVIFVYGVNDPRQFSHFNVFHAWASILLLTMVLLVSAIILYYLRRFAGVQRPNFMIGFLEVYSVVFGGGNIQYRHQLERLFFGAALMMSFFLVSIYLTDYSMHSVLREPMKIDTFDKLTERNIKFYLDTYLTNDRQLISGMISKKLKRGVNTIPDVLSNVQRSNKSFAIVVRKDNLHMYKTIFHNDKRDYDVLEESLGVTSQKFYLASHFYVPKRILDKFNQVSISLIESGWFQFMESLESFWIQLKTRADGFVQRHEFDFQPITLDEFKYPIIIYCLHVIGITLIFICEIIWVHAERKWRQYKQWKQNFTRNVERILLK